MPSLAAVMLHGLIKNKMDKINQAIRAADKADEKVALYRRELLIEAGSIVPGNCQIEEDQLGGRPATWIRPDGAPTDRLIFFLHGGGYIGGSVRYSRNSAADLARSCGLQLLSLDYRLAPEHPYPAARDDVLAAMGELIERGYACGNIMMAGESAGGGLALAATLAILDAGWDRPAAVVALSPWCDLTLGNITLEANDGKDIMLTPYFLHLAAELYAGGQDRHDPFMSPLFGDYTGFPPLLLQVAAEELLLGETIELANRARGSGVAVQLAIFDGMWHVWQTLNELIPESRAALDQIGEFARSLPWSTQATPA